MSVSELTATRSREEWAGVSSGLHEVELSSCRESPVTTGSHLQPCHSEQHSIRRSLLMSKCHSSLLVVLPLPPCVRALFQKMAESGKPKACMLHTRLRNFSTPGFLGCGPVVLTLQHGFQHIQFYTQTTAGSWCFLGLESESMFVPLCPASDRNLKA